MEALWSEALPLLREQLGERNFICWIEPICCRAEGDGVRLEVPSRFFQDWVVRHFLQAITHTLTKVAGRPCAVRVEVAAQLPRLEVTAPRANTTPRAKPRGPKLGRLIEHYTFRSFIVGPSNEMAYRAAQTVAAAPGRRFNPVVIYGGVGLGKTHLVNAIGHDLLRRWPRIRIACLSAESFMNDLITSLRTDQMNGFRNQYRTIDALILDDVHILGGKDRTQEEFFHTFNALYGAGKQIVLTSDKPPSAINGLEDRLRSRFEGGLLADIHPPTHEMRIAIVFAKALAHGIKLAPDVAEELVGRCGPSIREIEGGLTRVAALAALRGEPLTAELVRGALFVPSTAPAMVSVEHVQGVVSQHFGIVVEDLISHRRDRRVSLPRQIAMYLSRTVAEASYLSIAEKFGNRDHTTVMHAVKAIESRRNSDATVARSLNMLERQLRGR